MARTKERRRTRASAGAIEIRLSGTPLPADDGPALLAPRARRGAGGAVVDDPFVPPGFLRVRTALDLEGPARSADAVAGEVPLQARRGDLLVLETVDGETLITTGAHLREALVRTGQLDPAATTIDLDAAVRAAQSRTSPASRSLGDTVGLLFSRAFEVAVEPGSDAITARALARLAADGMDGLVDRITGGVVEWGVSTVAVRALMWAIEAQLDRAPGLYRWTGPDPHEGLRDLDDDDRAALRAGQPALVFVHGTASSTLGSFAAMRGDDPQARSDWARVEARYGRHVYGFEHRTWSESPIDNALQLVEALPDGARIDLVTHSRGGLVGDLVAADWRHPQRSAETIARLRRGRRPDHADDPDLDAADARDRERLAALAQAMRERGITVGRYVRVAAPAAGTSLAGSHLDVMLSTLLGLAGKVAAMVPAFLPYFAATRRVVIEIVRARMDPNRVPGLEAMLPGSSLAGVLRLLQPQESVRLGIIAGDIERAPGLRRVVELLADWTVYGGGNHDLIVDTASMLGGLARPGMSARRFVFGPAVHHFAYFSLAAPRAALVAWLREPAGVQVADFQPLAQPLLKLRTEAIARSRGADAKRPYVLVLPGSMGTHLTADGDRIWLDPIDILRGRLDRIGWQPAGGPRVEAEHLFDDFYGDLCERLARTHAVEPFPYDWRLPIEEEGRRFAAVLRRVLDHTRDGDRPVRILAHSMGGLIARAAAAADAPAWSEFLGREGSRFVMLGTPNRGSHETVANLLGKGETMRRVAVLDATRGLQGVLDVVGNLRGVLQLLPRPGWQPPVAGDAEDWFDSGTWRDIRARGEVTDAWFGDGRVARPDAAACDAARGLWTLPGFDADRIPGPDPRRVIYVAGWSPTTACGIRRVRGRIKLLGSPDGDGTVLWDSGRIDGIGSAYLMPVDHGDLPRTPDHFDALVDLLERGETDRLTAGWPSTAQRAAAAGTPPAEAVPYDAGPALLPSDEELAAVVLGVRPHARRGRDADTPAVKLSVGVAAMDLRWVRDPVLVGHYVNDPISGAEAAVDRHVVAGELTVRNHLGLYPGPVGTALAVLLPDDGRQAIAGVRRGAVVTGLGDYGGLTATLLTEAVKMGALRYLLGAVEVQPRLGGGSPGAAEPIVLGLATVLVGYNSTANIAIADSLRALVQGVIEANRQFEHARGELRAARIGRLEIVERSIDIAISAARALPGVLRDLASERAGPPLVIEDVPLKEGTGVRQRLEAADASGYWPRLIVTASAEPGDDPSDAAGPATPVPSAARGRRRHAGRLRFVYLAQRARAEADGVQTQPEMVERLIEQAIAQPQHPRHLAQALFQLLVPHDFKEAARQSARLYLLVDEWTANYPWEMLRADDRPLVERTAVVRQFDTAGWRRRVRTVVDRTALVIGDPSTRGFGAVFPLPDGREVDPVALDGADAEARAVARALERYGFGTHALIGQQVQALSVFEQLYARPYRIVHIAAHGEFDLMGRDGRRRSGVLLSDGLLLTAAEFQQLEYVPDLVFLNCCHLGSIDAGATRGPAVNRLAASVAATLIRIGVRAVVVAGWAVDDLAAQLFAQAFYEAFVHDDLPFGDATHRARQRVLRAYPDTNTWGAYQAYGDPEFRLNPSRGSAAPTPDGGGSAFVSPRELIAELGALRDALSSSGTARGQGTADADDAQAVHGRIDAVLARAPRDADWRARPDVQHALAQVYQAMGGAAFPQAIAALQVAVSGAGHGDGVPISAIEALANLTARLADGVDAGSPAVQAQREQALVRLLGLGVATMPSDRLPPDLRTCLDAVFRSDGAMRALSPEQCCLLGGTHRRLAVQGVAGADAQALAAHLAASARWYRAADRGAADAYHGYALTNAVMLEALLGASAARPMADVAREARELGAWARARQSQGADHYLAMMGAESEIAHAIATGALDLGADLTAETEADIRDRFTAAIALVPATARERDSTRQALVQHGRIARALGRVDLAGALERIATVFDPPGT